MFIKKLIIMTIATGIAAIIAMNSAYAVSVNTKSQVDYNNSPISVTGTVVESKVDGFILNYNGGNITVEVDDWNWSDDESSDIKVGDQVTVNGNIDQDLYEKRKIEAGNVYVHNTRNYYFADSDDEEDIYYNPYFYMSNTDKLPDGTWVSVRGTIKEINGREFKLDLGKNSITVNTDGLNYNPFDNTGYQKISVGDRVYVSGDIDVGFFDAKEIDADQIIELRKIVRAK